MTTASPGSLEADGRCRLILLFVLLTLSLSLNAIFVTCWIRRGFSTSGAFLIQRDTVTTRGGAVPLRKEIEEFPTAGWSRKASEAAEETSLVNCSGNGDMYTDTLPVTADVAEGVCECYECFTGPHCSERVENCSADVTSGTPLLFAPFWKQNAEEGAVLIPGWYRIGYSFMEDSSVSISPALEREIRILHNLVGNAVVDNKYIVLGVGSMQLLKAAVACLASDSGSTAVVTAVPYYPAYREQSLLFGTAHFTWAGDANVYAQQHFGMNSSTIEFVNSPNNPDGMVRHAVLNGSDALTIHDYAYYWPHFTAITEAADQDVMLFSLSKISGHAGSRLGWAIVKNYTHYERLLTYLYWSIITVSHETQLRATQLLRVINGAYSGQLHAEQMIPLDLPPAYYASKGLSFHYGYVVLHDRWMKLNRILNQSNRFGLQHLEPVYCKFFNEVTGPSPAYAWVYCKQENDEDCQAVLEQAGIISRGGDKYESSIRYTRLSLLKRALTFENLINHLSSLVSQEIDFSSCKSQVT
ncbi:hypothetical protein KP509_25G013500 [Ceratopteris richardii]|uniref:Uncharacterized protein n=1 Tax=Ceratopteris richardii TaxID=49495 RepID=A0A8T2RNZ4_CERRI|nr:hypothetical protein KP509_25G013500 [Ceratopteris richardii]